MNVTIVNGQATLSLNSSQEARMIEAMAVASAKAQQEAKELRCTYHLGAKPTNGRGYDDRLTMRTGYSRSTLLPILKHGVGKKMKYGVLVGLLAANKWIVSEEAVRVWLGNAK